MAVCFPKPFERMEEDMKAHELTVTINAKLDVDIKTAETCLRLVEAYVNANPVVIVADREPNGEVHYHYEPVE